MIRTESETLFKNRWKHIRNILQLTMKHYVEFPYFIEIPFVYTFFLLNIYNQTFRQLQKIILH